MGTRFTPSYPIVHIWSWEQSTIYPRDKLWVDVVLWQNIIDDVVFVGYLFGRALRSH